MAYLLAIHVLCVFVTFNRETTGGQIDGKGTIMKILEILAMAMLYQGFLLAVSQVTVWHTLRGNINKIIEV